MALKGINTIINANQKPSQLLMALTGCLVGLFLVMASIQSYFNINNILKDKKQGIGAQYLVINKKITTMNTLNVSKSSFSDDQIEEIQNHPSIQKMSKFLSNNYEAEAFLELRDGPTEAKLKTDLFLESVDDEFVDVDLEKWKWKQGDSVVPIILPNDFINLYNFTYAPSRGLPQISKNTLKLFGFNIIARGNGKEEVFRGTISGFSDRITSMITPMSFMKYSNEKFGDKTEETKKPVYRIITAVKPSQMSSFYSFMTEHNFETNQELLKNGKFTSMLFFVVSIMLVLGVIIVFNAFTGFILYFQMIIYRSTQDLDSLLRLGYPHKKLMLNYQKRIALILISLYLLAVAGVFYIQRYVAGLLIKYNFEMPGAIHSYTVFAVAGIIALLFLLFSFTIRKEIYKIALPVNDRKR